MRSSVARCGLIVLHAVMSACFCICHCASADTADRLPPEELASGVVAAVERTRSYPRPAELCGREDLIPVVHAGFAELKPSVRRDLVDVLLNVGADPRRRQARWLFSESLTEFLVKVLTTDGSPLVRQKVLESLENGVPANYICAWTREIVSFSRENPDECSILLLGKTGSIQARKLLEEDPRFSQRNRVDTDLALAKLGNAALSLRFVEDFEKETDPRRKAKFAEALGYIGDAACVLALAEEIRSDAVYVEGGARTPLRVEVARALGVAYPENPVFWVSPLQPPQDDSWYEGMESWLHRTLGVTWRKERPPFSYSQPLPTPATPPLLPAGND